MKILHLKFSDAKLFPKNKISKDYVFDKAKGMMSQRKNMVDSKLNFIQPITKYQISNALHVLMGKRPVPSFRDVSYSIDPSIMDMAESSYIKISTPRINKKKQIENRLDYVYEGSIINKSARNSYKKVKSFDWFNLQQVLGTDLFNRFVTDIESVIGYDPRTKMAMELNNIYEVYGTKLDFIIEYLVKNKRTAITKMLRNKLPSDNAAFVGSEWQGDVQSGYSESHTIENGVHNFDGDIYVPMEESDLSRIKKNVCTILDGGLLEIVGIFDENDLIESEFEDYELVSNISTEKY